MATRVFEKPVNREILDTQRCIAIVANGNTHAAITTGQFVYIKSHSTLEDGLYVATSDIAEDGELSSSNVTEETSGGLNELNDRIESVEGNIPPVVNNLTSDSTTSALSAAQGKALNSKIGAFKFLNSPASVQAIISALPNTGDTAVVVASGTLSAEYGLSGVTYGIWTHATSTRYDFVMSKQNGYMVTGNATVSGSSYTITKYTNYFNSMHRGTLVKSFSNGSVSIDWSDMGVSSKQDCVILTPQSDKFIMQYDYDNSTSSKCKINAVLRDGSTPTGAVRFSYMIYE